MRSTRTSLLLAASAAFAASVGLGFEGALRRQGHREGYRPTPPHRDTEQAREIADWNEAVERRKAEKKARKRDRTQEGASHE